MQFGQRYVEEQDDKTVTEWMRKQVRHCQAGWLRESSLATCILDIIKISCGTQCPLLWGEVLTFPMKTDGLWLCCVRIKRDACEAGLCGHWLNSALRRVYLSG